MSEPEKAAERIALLSSEVSALEQLLAVHERVVIEQAEGAEEVLADVRRRAERLEHSERALRNVQAILDSMGDGVVVYEADGRLRLCNPAARRILRMGEGDLESSVWIGGRLCRLCDIDGPPAGREQLCRQLPGGRSLEGEEICVPGTDGSGTRWLSVTSRPLRCEDGSLEGGVAVLRDITEARRVELDLSDARDSAERATRVKSDFLANMSHEIRTPMNGVMGMTALLLDTPLSAEQSDYAQSIQSSAEALLSVINDILDFSKIEADKLDLEPIGFDLRHVVEETVGVFAARTLRKGLEIVLDLSPEVPSRLIGDPGRIRQVLTNLIGNAVKFTESGHVVVRVESRGIRENNALLRFSIEDTGIGIPQDRVVALFDKFTQADSSITRRYGGTGLGLAIVKKLIELMGGEIGVQSQQGEGSCFWFEISLPVEIEAQEELSLADLSEVPVLIVDDLDVNRQILERMTRGFGMRSQSCPSAETALGILRERTCAAMPIQIVVVDQQMPGMKGEVLASEIRSDPAIGDVSLVMATSMGTRGDAELFSRLGF